MNPIARLRRYFRSQKATSSLEVFRELFGSPPASSGVEVTWKTALEVAAVLDCVRVVAEGVSQVPFKLYRDDGSGSKSVASDHPVHELISTRPNDWQTSFEFRETLMFHLMLTTNAFVFLNKVGSERMPVELIILEPGKVSVEQLSDMRLQYKVRGANGNERIFPQEAIWHLRGPSWNSWMGLELTRLAREAIGLSISIERGQGSFQKGGARTSGLLSVEDTLTKEQYKDLADWLEKHEAGGAREGKTIIADRGAKYAQLTLSAVDQQLIESRKFQIEEICRVFRVMPLMVGHPADMAARAATESIFLTHVVHTLSPWYTRIEQSADVNLLSPADREDGLYTKFTANALMRGAAKDRAEYYAKALGSGGSKGWMTQNDVRGLEELDRIDDPEADKLPQQINATTKMTEPETAPEPEPEDDDE